MIRQNQRLLNHLNVLSDGLIVYAMLPLAFWLRFFVLPGGQISEPLVSYLRLGVGVAAAHLATFALFGLYRSFRRIPLHREVSRLFFACVLDIFLLLSFLYLFHGMHYSRWVVAIFLVLELIALGLKRFILRRILRYFRQKGYNLKHVVLLGDGKLARAYLSAIRSEPELGYSCAGYVAARRSAGWGEVRYLGGFEKLAEILEETRPDEVISAIDAADYDQMPAIIAACEKDGTKLSIIPFYASYIPARPRFDELGGLPLLNIRRIPLDELWNAFIKRTVDIAGSAVLLTVLSPVLLICAIGVKLSSPGPVIFRQERVGRGKKPFYMYKFRSMRVNKEQDTAWSARSDNRRTRFGSFLRKCSLDELPQLWNVLWR